MHRLARRTSRKRCRAMPSCCSASRPLHAVCMQHVRAALDTSARARRGRACPAGMPGARGMPHPRTRSPAVPTSTTRREPRRPARGGGGGPSEGGSPGRCIVRAPSFQPLWRAPAQALLTPCRSPLPQQKKKVEPTAERSSGGAEPAAGGEAGNTSCRPPLCACAGPVCQCHGASPRRRGAQGDVKGRPQRCRVHPPRESDKVHAI